MKTKYTLLLVIIYIGFLDPLIQFLGNTLLVYFGSPSVVGKYHLLLDIPMWFIPLVLTFTIEKGWVKTIGFIISGLYILKSLGLAIYISITV